MEFHPSLGIAPIRFLGPRSGSLGITGIRFLEPRLSGSKSAAIRFLGIAAIRFWESLLSGSLGIDALSGILDHGYPVLGIDAFRYLWTTAIHFWNRCYPVSWTTVVLQTSVYAYPSIAKTYII
jgi:hypothetical protein